MWIGGVPPYSYRIENRKLVVEEESAEHIRRIFAHFLEVGSCTELACEAAKRGIRTPRGNRIDKKYLYRMLNHRGLDSAGLKMPRRPSWPSILPEMSRVRRPSRVLRNLNCLFIRLNCLAWA